MGFLRMKTKISCKTKMVLEINDATLKNIIFPKDCITKLIAWGKRLSKGSRSVQVRILQTIGIIYPPGDKTIIGGDFVSVKESFIILSTAVLTKFEIN